MSRKMRTFGWCILSCVVLSIALICAPTPSYGFEIAIDVSPSTLNIQSQSEVVTVHTSIGYTSVISDNPDYEVNVFLNDIPIAWWKADNQGNFVAKFLMSEVKNLVDSGAIQDRQDYDLKLVGYTNEGTEFTGTQTITVIDVIPSGAGGK